MTASRSAGLDFNPKSVSGVSTRPGAIAAVVKPCGASSTASCRVRARSRAPLLGVVERVQRLAARAVERGAEENPPAALRGLGSPHHFARDRDRNPDVEPKDEVEVVAGQIRASGGSL